MLIDLLVFDLLLGCVCYFMSSVREKFETGIYSTITEFVADMRLLLENCYRFNGPDHSISRKAQRIETLLEQKLALLSRYHFIRVSVLRAPCRPHSCKKSPDPFLGWTSFKMSRPGF